MNKFNGTAMILKDGEPYANESITVETRESKPDGKFNGLKDKLKAKYKSQFPNSIIDVNFLNFTLVR